MVKFAEQFIELMNKFISRKMRAQDFFDNYSKLFYDESIQPENDEIFGIIDQLWGWLDKYEPKTRLRRKYDDYINATQLRCITKKYKEMLTTAIKNYEVK